MVEIYLRISRKGAILSTATHFETITFISPGDNYSTSLTKFSFTLKKRPYCGAKYRLWLAGSYLQLFEPWGLKLNIINKKKALKPSMRTTIKAWASPGLHL